MRIKYTASERQQGLAKQATPPLASYRGFDRRRWQRVVRMMTGRRTLSDFQQVGTVSFARSWMRFEVAATNRYYDGDMPFSSLHGPTLIWKLIDSFQDGVSIPKINSFGDEVEQSFWSLVAYLVLTCTSFCLRFFSPVRQHQSPVFHRVTSPLHLQIRHFGSWHRQHHLKFSASSA